MIYLADYPNSTIYWDYFGSIRVKIIQVSIVEPGRVEPILYLCLNKPNKM